MALNIPSIIATSAADVSTELAQDSSQIVVLFNNLGIDLPFITAQIINFCIVAFILYYFAFKPILASLATRKQRISDGLQYAEEMKQKLAETERHYAEKMKDANREAQVILDQARENAKEYTEKQTQDAVHQAEEILKKAQDAAVIEHQKMLNNLKKEVAALVVNTSEKVLNRSLSEGDKNTFAENAAKELAANN